MVDISGNAKWSIFNSVAADSNTKDVVGDTNRLIGMIIQKQIAKSTIREIATERKIKSSSKKDNVIPGV